MSFGDGDLHKRVDELENAYKLLQADFDITRERWMMRGAYIAKQRERIKALESLVKDMYAEWCATVDDYYAGNIDGYYERMAELGIEVGE